MLPVRDIGEGGVVGVRVRQPTEPVPGHRVVAGLDDGVGVRILPPPQHDAVPVQRRYVEPREERLPLVGRKQRGNPSVMPLAPLSKL